MRKLVVAAVVAAFLVIPAGAALADTAGFRSAGLESENRIHPFLDGETYCASQDLGVWVFVIDERQGLLDYLEIVDFEFTLDGDVLDNTYAAVSSLARGFQQDNPTGLWRTAIGDPSVGLLDLGSHELTTVIYEEGAPVFTVDISFTINDC